MILMMVSATRTRHRVLWGIVAFVVMMLVFVAPAVISWVAVVAPTWAFWVLFFSLLAVGAISAIREL